MRPPQSTRPLLALLPVFSRRTWIGLAIVAIVLLGLALSVAAFALSRLWNAGSHWLDVSQATTTDTAMAEGQKRLDALLPGLQPGLQRGHEALSAALPEARESLESIASSATLDRGREILAIAAPDTLQRLEAQASGLLAPLATVADPRRIPDVPGEDIEAVPRHPAMSRTAYALAEGERTVRYSGQVDFDQALSFHRRSLLDAGFSERILASSPGAFSAEYRLGARALHLDVKAGAAGTSELGISER